MKEVYKIKYEYQVFVPLYYLKNNSNNDIVELKQGEMLDYRIKTAQEFAYKDMVVDYETGLTGIDKLKSDYNDYLEIINLEDGGILYRLKDGANIESIINNLSSSLPPEIINVLTNEDNIKTCFKERGLR